jgi:putative Holliday junction resolvase
MGRILGVDHGDRRIGIAISDPMPLIATPLKTLAVVDQAQAIADLNQIIKENNIEVVVIGLPLGMKGQETKQTLHVQKFSKALAATGVEIIMEDERLSSLSAKKILQEKNISIRDNKGLIDQTAATVILQQYLDKINR